MGKALMMAGKLDEAEKAFRLGIYDVNVRQQWVGHGVGGGMPGAKMFNVRTSTFVFCRYRAHGFHSPCTHCQNPYSEEDMRRNKECSMGISNVHAVRVHVDNAEDYLKRCVSSCAFLR